MQLGFVIDHSRCIGCHACTVACKSENQVPVGSFRTWVKYTERGEFPEVRRSFAVLRCNQCSNAPCVTICPVSALEKRSDGIVDVDPKACIGCKACMMGCPYDALYINEEKGTAEKCHFCAHRTEVGLAPACAVVCPTEAILPGDFDDPDSVVSRMRREHSLTARKTEAGTGPNVLYRDAAPAGLDPGQTNLSQGFIWSQNPTGPQADAQLFESMEKRAEARTVYDVPRKLLWGRPITGYLFAKSIAAGVFPVAWIAAVLSGGTTGWVEPLIALLAIAFTSALLVFDLKRPERFFYILIRPNWNSWLARGTFAIAAYGTLLTAWFLAGAFGGGIGGALGGVLGALTIAAGGLTAAYTGWLFAQAKGRVLWMKRGLWAHLLVQAALAGAATLALIGPVAGIETAGNVERIFMWSLAAHALFTWFEGRLAPKGREAEYHRASALITRGPFKVQHWAFGFAAGILAPMVLILAAPQLLPLAGVLALVGLWIEEDLYVRAGQALPIS